MKHTNKTLLDSQSIWESNARSYPIRIPIAIKKAYGIHIEDVDGKVYYDCLSGAGTLALGHNHPVVIEAIEEVIAKRAPLHILDFNSPIKQAFVDEIFSILPEKMRDNSKIQFCGPTGADAVEACTKLVKTATGNRTMLSFTGGYHGMTNGALSLTGNLGAKEDVPGLMSDVHFMPFPYKYRCPFSVGGDSTEDISINYIKNLLDDPEGGITSIAGMIFEVVQGESGVIPAPDSWVKRIRDITKDKDIPLIVDEVQTGFGRTGKMFAFEHSGITPDAVVLSKAIGGSLPMSVVIYDKSLDKWSKGAHAGTFRGNVLAMNAGLKSIQYIREQNLDIHAERMGNLILSRLGVAKNISSLIGDVRGKGLMVGVEIVDPTKEPDVIGSYPYNPEAAREIQLLCLERGLILELGGRHGSVVRFLPPLIITEKEVEIITDIFINAVLEVDLKRKKELEWV